MKRRNTLIALAVALIVLLIAGGFGARWYWSTKVNPNVSGNAPKLDGVDFNRSTFAELRGPTSMVFGPDGALYVSTVTGRIAKYVLTPDGRAAGEPTFIDVFKDQRTIMGIVFDPKATAENPILWVSNSAACFSECPDFVGGVSVLTGQDLSQRRDVISGLPRSVTDHMTNGLAFGPDGRLYIAQGANTAYGAPDATWGFREEVPLAAAILIADVHNDPRLQTTVDVDTSKGYNATAPDAPVRTYVTGTRNPFDLIWHTNGSLYVPVNESSIGSSPAGPNNNPPALTDIPAGNDFLVRATPGKYYGHPNPSRGEFVLNGGNPTSKKDPWEVKQYPVGQQPAPAWQAPIVSFGEHRSANGISEYKADAFKGVLKGQLLVVEYAQGNDLVAVKLDAQGNFSKLTQVAGGFYNPVDVLADPVSGRVYVAEYGKDQTDGENGKLVLLTP